MSTVPGDDALRDAGLVSSDLDESVTLAEELERGPAITGDGPAEDYAPGTPRPDQAGAATEADVVEQASIVPVPDDDV